MAKLYSLKKLFRNTFEGHKGRPGERGGSSPKSGGDSSSSTSLGEAPSVDMFDGTGKAKGKFPSGWRGSGESITKRITTKSHGDYRVMIEYHSGYYAHLVAIGDMRSSNFLPNSPTIDKGNVKWENLQGELDSLSKELSSL